jgi:two-component system NtrC family sensor kinase
VRGALLGALCVGFVTAAGMIGRDATFFETIRDPGLFVASVCILLSCTAAGVFGGRRLRRRQALVGAVEGLQHRLGRLADEERRAQDTLERLAREEASLREQAEILSAQLDSSRLELEESRSEVRKSQLQWLQAERLASLSSLIAGITHELNNPLAVISGFAELLGAQVNEQSDIHEMVDAIHIEAKRCTRIVHNLLTFARQRRPTLTPVDLNEIIRDVMELFRFKMSLDDVRVESDLHQKLPTTMGDVSQLQQVVLHLVSNAQEALRDIEGAREISVTTRHDEDTEHVVLEVEHTGRAFSDSEILHLFEPFQPGAGTRDDDGLGLALCYGLVKEHRGSLAAARRGERGMRFTVRLRAGARPADATPPDVARRRALAAGRGVLIVDDEPGVQGLIRRVLSGEGYRCATAGDGAEALRMLGSGAYDLVIADIRMPNLGGIDFFRRLERDFPSLAARTIFTSGDSVTVETKEFLHGVPNHVLPKPFEVDQLVSAVSTVACEIARPEGASAA